MRRKYRFHTPIYKSGHESSIFSALSQLNYSYRHYSGIFMPALCQHFIGISGILVALYWHKKWHFCAGIMPAFCADTECRHYAGC